MKTNEMEAVAEALLFISGESVPVNVIAQAIGMDEVTAKSLIQTMAQRFKEQKRGIQIVEFDGKYQMCTASWCFDYIRNISKNDRQTRLSQSLLETLAIIAYKQPVTKQQIEEIRGVSAEHSVNKLVERNLVKEAGRLDSVGKPILFGTTEEFLRYFGFHSLEELPVIES